MSVLIMKWKIFSCNVFNISIFILENDSLFLRIKVKENQPSRDLHMCCWLLVKLEGVTFDELSNLVRWTEEVALRETEWMYLSFKSKNGGNTVANELLMSPE